MDKRTAGVMERLKFIDFSLFWEGKVSRPRLQKEFGISPQQATTDLKRYQDQSKGNLRYSLQERRYLPADGFKPSFIEPNANEYLRFLDSVALGYRQKEETWITEFPTFDTLTTPKRRVNVDAFRLVLTTLRQNQSVEINYTSATKAVHSWRRVTPLSLGNDGHRWHVRGYDSENNRFSDFAISRISGARRPSAGEATLSQDESWNEFVTIIFAPDKRLKPDKYQSTLVEYNMRQGTMKVKTRKAMLYYYLRRFGFDPKPLDEQHMRNESSYHLIIENLNEVKDWLDIRH